LFFLILPPHPHSTLFPYTTLFRSGFWPPVAVSPRRPGSVAMIFSSMCGGGVTTSGTLFHRVTMHTTPSLSHCAFSPTADTMKCRSEEHTSELQSRGHLVCRLLLEK